MKPRYRMAIGMFLLVVVAGGLSAAIFVFQGSQAALYAQIAVVPLLIVVGYAWVNRTVKSTGTSRTEFERRKIREVGEQFGETWQLAQRIEQEDESLVTDAEWNELEGHVSDLESIGIKFDRNSGSSDISRRNIGSLEEINNVQGQIDDLDEWLLTAVTQNAKDRIDEVNTALEQLRSLVTDPKTIAPSAVPQVGPESQTETADWEEAADTVSNCYRQADQLIEEACQGLQEAATSTDGSTATTETRIEDTLSRAREAATQRRYRDAATTLLETRDTVQRDAADSFDTQREAIEDLLRAASTKSFDEHLGPAHHEDISDYKRELQELDDAIEISELRVLRDQVRSTCLDVVRELEAEVDAALEKLQGGDVPRGWYDHPDDADVDFLHRLRNTERTAAFQKEWEDAVDRLLAVLGELKPKASVVSGFDRIEPKIEQQLRSEGVVRTADLPVGELEEQFLGLYYRRHMDEVNFDPSGPRLSAVGDSATYDVHLTVSFPTGGTERELSASLDGPGTDRTASTRTPLVGEVTFEDVSYGEYTLAVTPGPDEFAPVERTVLVDSETTIDVELDEITLRDRLCDGVDVDVDQVLSQMSGRFETTFDEERHLSTHMSFPVADEYVPCLLAAWATQQGHEVVKQNGDVIVFEPQRIRKEIENVIRYNIGEGESKTYEEFRNNFLSAPVPDHTVTDLIRSSSEHEVVTIDGTTVIKEES